MSKALRDIIAEIQFRLKLTQEEIAERIGYSRPYLTNAIKNNSTGKILDTINREFSEILQYVPRETEASEPEPTYIARRRDSKLKSSPFLVPFVSRKAQAGLSDADIMSLTGHRDFTSYAKYLRDIGLDANPDKINKVSRKI